jgi:oxalate---CoA ligase
MWNALVEEGREKKLKQVPLSRCPEQLPCSTTGENDILIAEAALKVLFFPSIRSSVTYF